MNRGMPGAGVPGGAPLFEGLDLEEPAARTDAAVAAAAREALIARGAERRRRFRVRWTQGALAASILGVLFLALLGDPARQGGAPAPGAADTAGPYAATGASESREPAAPPVPDVPPTTVAPFAPGTSGSSAAVADAPAASLDELDGLRTELDEIEEMADLIPEVLAEARDRIAQRVRTCQRDLDSLERSLQGFDRSSMLEPERKETRI